jgi:predicted nucleic acid-binding protein
VIYLDSSVALAKLFTEDRNSPDSFWDLELVSSRLLVYEVWNRLHARQLAQELGERARFLLNLVRFVELGPVVLERALEPFPRGIRTLDALHLASADYLRTLGQTIEVASFNRRLIATARDIDFAIYDL